MLNFPSFYDVLGIWSSRIFWHFWIWICRIICYLGNFIVPALFDVLRIRNFCSFCHLKEFLFEFPRIFCSFCIWNYRILWHFEISNLEFRIFYPLGNFIFNFPALFFLVCAIMGIPSWKFPHFSYFLDLKLPYFFAILGISIWIFPHFLFKISRIFCPWAREEGKKCGKIQITPIW